MEQYEPDATQCMCNYPGMFILISFHPALPIIKEFGLINDRC